jgi:hypothetical protein
MAFRFIPTRKHFYKFNEMDKLNILWTTDNVKAGEKILTI